jgi:dephospho-CoA kinase
LLRIGITGGLGSGKSTVCHIFRFIGVPVYEADLAARRLMQEDEALQQSIRATFGADSYVNGAPNRPYLAQVVFGNAAKLQELNQLVHPAVFRDFESWCAEQQAPYAIKEAAIIFESGSQRQLHSVVAVLAPTELRIQRAMLRDGAERKAIESRMAHQLPQEILTQKSQHLIFNDGKHPLIPQVLALHQRFLALAVHPPPYLTA